jgi:murein L,D-transpeptidase YafK
VRALALAALAGWLAAPPLAPGVTAERLLVDKSERTLTVIWQGAALKTYRVALGGEPNGHKLERGDQRTPEGVYVVTKRLEDSAFHRALVLSYPNADDRARAKAARVAPGSDIAIHGLKPEYAWLGSAHVVFDWTDGCIAVTNREMEELFRAVPKGTPVEIRP